jgi:ribosomal-protein-serine acetyltransferase
VLFIFVTETEQMQWSFDHYTLRPVLEEDLQQYFDLIDNNRKRLEDFFAGTVAATKTIDQTKTHLSDVISKHQSRKFYPYIIADNLTGELVGSIQIKSIDWNIPKAELGYYVDSRYEGKGIITRGVSILVDFAFRELKMQKLFVRTHESNIGSKLVAEKNGFKIEGLIKRDYKTTKGEVVDLLYYGLLNPVQ